MFHNTLIHSQYTVGMKSSWDFERVIKKSQSTTKQLMSYSVPHHASSWDLTSDVIEQVFRSGKWYGSATGVEEWLLISWSQLSWAAGWDIGVRAGCVWRQSPRKAVMSHSALSSTFNPVMFIFTSDVRSCSARSPASHKLVTVELFFCLILMTFHYIKYGW